MVFQALTFLANKLDAQLKAEFQTPQTKAVLSPHVNTGSESGGGLDNQMSITLINVESESTIRNMQQSRSGSGVYQHLNPALRLNLRILVAANFRDYSEALKFLGSTLAFFQGHPVLTTEGTPQAEVFERLSVELEETNYQSWSYLWGMLGAKHLPGVVYKVKLLTIQDGVVLSTVPAITRVDAISTIRPAP